jgi:hypothetical protein
VRLALTVCPVDGGNSSTQLGVSVRRDGLAQFSSRSFPTGAARRWSVAGGPVHHSEWLGLSQGYSTGSMPETVNSKLRMPRTCADREVNYLLVLTALHAPLRKLHGRTSRKAASASWLRTKD